MIFNLFLTFSDGAKFAIIAKNLILGNGFTTDFSFWGTPFFGTSGISPMTPYLMSIFMRFFGVNDFSVIAFSFMFYLLLLIAVYLLAAKLFGKLVGVLSVVVVAASPDFINYATSGASETLFTFEIVLASYLTVLKKKWSNVFFILFLVAMYFSRPQAFIYIGGLVFFWLILNLGFKKGFLLMLGLGSIGLVIDKYIIYPLSFKYPVTPVIIRGLQSIFTYSSDAAVSDPLRGGASSMLSLSGIGKKVFYNLYNFYKLMPEILNPYLWALFVLGLFRWDKNLAVSSFKIFTVFVTAITFLVTAMAIPFFRYLHPVVPLVYIIAVETLVTVVAKITDNNYLFFKQIHTLKFKITKRNVITQVSLLIILFFAVGQTLGIVFLDSRFEKRVKNTGKPPVYVLLSFKLKEITASEDVVLTNLDTWGSWYGERKTIWFPLEPEAVNTKSDQIDAIYLTSYKIADENYFMGEKWREIFDNPEAQTILTDFKYADSYYFEGSSNYERENARAVLLIKK